MIIEHLEARIAPAAVTINPLLKTATWTDFDGDTVTLKYSTNAPTFLTTDAGQGLIVDRIGLTVADHSMESFTLKVKAGPVGDGHVNLGHVAGTGVPLKSWSSPTATVLDFDCGDGTTGIGSLKIGALGALSNTEFPAGDATPVSDIMGAVSAAVVQGDIGGVALRFTDPGQMKSLTVTGSLRGDAVNSPGFTSGILIATGGSIQTVTVGGSIIGGETTGEGQLFLGTKVGTLTVKGSVLGGTASTTGAIFGMAKTVKIGGSIVGGGNLLTGTIQINEVKSLTVGGSLVGGSEVSSGVANIGSVGATILIKGNIRGGVNTEATVDGAIGTLRLSGDVKTLTVGGDLVAGIYGSGQAAAYNGAIVSDGKIGTARIGGGIYGNNGTAAILIAKGSSVPALTGKDNAIGKLTVGGTVSFGYIAAGHGYDASLPTARIGAAENPDTGIGSVTVGGDWYHSNLTAGINDASSTGFSTGDTHSVGDPMRQAVLGPVVIKGRILDNAAAAGFSGFGAEKIASIIAGGVKIFKSGDPGRSLDAQGFLDVKEFA